MENLENCTTMQGALRCPVCGQHLRYAPDVRGEQIIQSLAQDPAGEDLRRVAVARYRGHWRWREIAQKMGYGTADSTRMALQRWERRHGLRAGKKGGKR